MKRVRQKKYYSILFLILFFLLLFIFLLPRSTQDWKDYQKTQIQIKNKIYTLFIADTEEKRARGLSGIAIMKDKEGMLFIFEKPDYHLFWMKDMRFPLDFIFLNGNKVIDLLSNINPSTYPQTFTSKSPSDKVIELKAGEINKLNLQKWTNLPSLQFIK